MKIQFSAMCKEVRSYVSMSGDKTFTVTFKGEDQSMAQAMAIPGEFLCNVTLDVIPPKAMQTLSE